MSKNKREDIGSANAYDEKYFTDEDWDVYNSTVDKAKSGQISWDDANSLVNNTLRSKYDYTTVADSEGNNSGAVAKNNQTYNANAYLLNSDNYQLDGTKYALNYSDYLGDDYNNTLSAYQSIIDQYLNRDPFSYDYTSDPSYQAYRKEYVREGNRAAADTLGQVAAATGGQVSSYAANASSQANDYYMAQLADKIPELYNAAYSRYQDEGNNLISAAGLYNTLANQYLNQANFNYGVDSTNMNYLYNADSSNVSNNYNTDAFNANMQYDVDQANKASADADKATAQEQLENIINLGGTPSDELISQSGYTQDYVNLLKAAYDAKNTKTYTSSKKTDEDEETSDFPIDDYVTTISDSIADGTETYTSVVADIQAKKNAGTITNEEANKAYAAATAAQKKKYPSIGTQKKGNTHKDE